MKPIKGADELCTVRQTVVIVAVDPVSFVVIPLSNKLLLDGAKGVDRLLIGDGDFFWSFSYGHEVKEMKL